MPSKPVTEFRIVLGKRMKYLRELHNMTQAQVMKALSYKSTATISLIEKGEMGMTMDKMIKASEVFETPFDIFSSPEEISDEELEMHVNVRKISKTPNHPNFPIIRDLLKVSVDQLK